MKKIRNILLMIPGLVLLPAVLFAAPGYCNGFFGPGYHNGFFFGGGIFMWIFNIAVLGLLIYLAVKFFRQGSLVAGNESALDILKKRLAKGEITKEEFEALKKEIS